MRGGVAPDVFPSVDLQGPFGAKGGEAKRGEAKRRRSEGEATPNEEQQSNTKD